MSDKYEWHHQHGTYVTRPNGGAAVPALSELNRLHDLVTDLEGVYSRCVNLFVRSVRDKTQIWPDDLGDALYGDEWEAAKLGKNR